MEFIYFIDSEVNRLLMEASPEANTAMTIKQMIIENHAAT
jgi:hypothetical protein